MENQSMLDKITELEEQIALLPKGSIGQKTVNGKEYYYQRWTENKKRREKYIPADEVDALKQEIEKRKALEKELKELRHLNICKLEGLHDISPLFNLPDLMRLWIGCITPIPAEQVARMQEIAPACEIDTQVVDPTTGNWRVTGYIRVSLPLYADVDFEQEVFAPRYYLLQEQFGYQDRDFAFARNDPLY